MCGVCPQRAHAAQAVAQLLKGGCTADRLVCLGQLARCCVVLAAPAMLRHGGAVMRCVGAWVVSRRCAGLGVGCMEGAAN